VNAIRRLTPDGSGAIAVLSVSGPEVWAICREHFTPKRGTLPETIPPAGTLRFGNIGGSRGDEVLLVATSPDRVEIHCHGGRLVVDWIVGLFRRSGCTVGTWHDDIPPGLDAAAWRLIPFAKTVRTAGILLDQAHGAFRNASENPDPKMAAILKKNEAVGRHLIEPWKVVIAGRPNAGKSSLMNAFAGFARAIVSPVPGTTRDAVSLVLAFDGWPVELTDTAGLRETVDELEREGVARARRVVGESDLCLWLIDAADPDFDLPANDGKTIVVVNKTDLARLDDPRLPVGAMFVSATTGEGIADLGRAIARRLVPDPPLPGEPVPYAIGEH
jgi:tRNA modification GTPase